MEWNQILGLERSHVGAGKETDWGWKGARLGMERNQIGNGKKKDWEWKGTRLGKENSQNRDRIGPD